MKNYTLLLLLFIGSIWSSFAQCEENVTNVLCADPANNVYIVSPTADVMIEILDSAGLPTLGVTWQNPRTFLYFAPAQSNAMTITPNTYTTAVYFNGSPHSSPSTLNPWPQAGAQANTTYTYNYTMPASAGCTPANGQIRIVTGGFTYDDYCTGDTTTLDDIPLLNYNTAGNLNWYSDAAGTTPIPNNTQIEGNQTYYVNLGITGCSQVFPVVVEYATPPASLDTLQRFCTGATWQAAGFPNPGDTLGDVDISGSNITWYSDAAGTMPVANPNSVMLNSGDVYYVSQEISGCEGPIQQINFVENECACIDENLAFHSEDYGVISSCNFGIDYTTPSNAYPASSVGLNDDPNTRFAHTNPGANIAFLANEGVTIPQTSPLGGSSGGIRINDYSPNKTGGTLVKEFIAGEVLTFDFLILFEDPDHDSQDQPSLTVKLLDAAGNMVQQRCIVSNPIDCIFNDVPNTGGDWLYSEWSCVKINTIELQGQAATIEITITDCDLGGHTGVAYIDRFYVGDDGPNICQDSAFGYMAIDPIDQAGASYEACSLFQEPVDPNCAPALPVINTTFPIEICGTFDAPIGNNAGGDAPITDIEVNIIGPNGNIVYSPPNFTQPNPGEFCITINQSDIPFPYGQFTVEGEIEYTMNCAVPPQPYEYYVQAQSNGFKFCPVAICPAAFPFCDDPNMPPTVDLTTRDTQVKSNYPASEHGNYTVTYYNTESGAHAQTGAIANPTAYPINTLPTGTTIVYVRLDYNYTALGISPVQDCYDIVPLEITIGSNPTVPATVNNITVCGDAGGSQALDLTVNEGSISANPVHTFEYYTTLANANAGTGVGEITAPASYSLASGTTQAIYVRVENVEGCYDVSQFNAVVNLNPDVPANIPDINECDDDTDGYVAFDLTENEPILTQNEPNPGDYGVVYYPTATDRTNGSNEITSPTTYTNTVQDTQTIYVIVEDVNTGCTTEAEFIINVVEAPVLTTPPAYELCDGDGDNQASFDLTTLNGQISTDPGLTFTYHATQSDADNNITSTIATPYQSLSTTIYVRAEYAGSGCYETVAVLLTVNPDPDVPSTIADLEICDDDTDGTATFDLTDREGDITVNQPTGTTYDVSYYASASDRTNGVPITSETSYPSTSATIYVLVEDTSTSCTTESQFDIVVNPLPDVPATVPALEECDDDNDGLMFFDLTDNEAVLTQNAPSGVIYTVSYYSDAGHTTSIATPTNHQNSPAGQQTIYVLVTDSDTGCETSAQFEIIVNAQLPTTAPAPYELCDGNGDGQATFDLTTLNNQISTDPTYSYSYHATQADAQAGTPTIANNYTTGSTTAYVRVESTAVANCYNVVPAQLVVVPDPLIPVVPDLELCDDNTDGQESFDLTQNEPTIVQNEPNPGDYTVTYYASLTDLNNNNPITTPAAYTNTAPDQQTIHVLVEDTNTSCTSQAQFDIIVNPIPAYNTPAPLIICDDGGGTGMAEFDLTDATTQITGNAPNLNVSYFETQLGADNNDPNDEIGPLYTNTTPYNQTVWVRVYDINTGCYAVDSMDLQVNDAPIANTPPPFVYCDDDNDGVGQFILTDLDDDINNDPNVTITYHQTQANADNDVIPLSSPFTNTVNTTQTIYVRVEAPGISCYTTIAITLQVEDSPQPVLAQDLEPLEACDTNGNGSEVFDLTQMEAAILANDVPPAAATDFTIRYYTDAAYTQEITVPTAYTSNGMNQTIYVVVEGLNGCTGETSFELIVHPMPTYQHPQPLELCDVNNPGDEMEAFTLEDATIDITNGDNTLDVSYYDNQADADAGTNPLSSPYTNTENNQTIYVRVEDGDTGCFVSQGFTLTLVVNPLPSPQVPTDPLEVCDVDNDGFVEFDLAAQIPIIQNGETDVTITFHLTQGAAESGNQAIDTSQPFGISSANNQTIYVRATNDLTGCYVVEPLTLEVVPSPTIEDLEDLYVCDDETLDGFAMFDLTQNTPNVLGTQDPTTVTVTYYESQADAEAGTNWIAVPSQYTNIVNPQQIFVRIEHNTTECYDTFDFAGDNSFWIEVELYPAVVEPTDLTLCDDDYNTVPVPQTIFDLTVKEGEMSGQNSAPGNYQFTYYANDADYQAGTPIADPENYQNVANPQTLVVEVVNTDTQGLCATTVNLTINVLPLPSPDTYTPDQLRLYQCDDDNDGVAAEAFDLTQSGDMIAGGENVNLSYYTNESAAEQGDTASASYIATPDQYVNDPSLNVLNADGVPVQIIYVRVESGVAGNDCYVVTSFEIQVVPAPVLNPAGQPFGYTLCEDGNSGTAAVQLDDIAENVYDLTNGDPATLIPLLDPNGNDDLDINNYEVSYYFTAQGAEDGDSTQEVPNGYDASDGESFFIRIEYLSTGCYNTDAIGEVVITVEQRPAINAVDLNETLCSDEQGGNSVTVDLTQYDGQISTGAPNTAVVYYADMNAYMSGDEVADPTGFTTTDNPQTVIAEVIDTETLCESADFATITFNINTTPIVDISGYDGMIICEDLDPSTPTEGGDYTPITIDTGLSQTQYDFVWTLDGTTLPETGSSIDATQAGTYEVTVTDVFNNCSAGSSAAIGASNPPEFTATATTLAFAGEHTVVVSNVTGIGDYEFSIDNGPWTDLGSNTSLTFEGLGGGTHTIRGRDKNGCGTTIVTITIVDYPAFFTPNNDGYNDTWNIYGLAESDPSAKIYIFDRYGKLLKQISPIGEGWDGTYNGTQMPSGDYWFKVEYRELDVNTGQLVRRELVDNITLKR